MGTYDIQFGGFDKLMPNRVREALLVAAPFDSFLLADDDNLTELIFSEYLDLNLRCAPRVTRVSTPQEALDLMDRRKFDIVIAMGQAGMTDIGAFCVKAKKISPGIPVILLCFNMPDVMSLPEEDKKSVDRIFLWLGDPRIFMAVIKLAEDALNIDHDIGLSNVQAIIVVEDSVRFYSAYLPIIYAEFMKQTHLVMSEGMNLSHKMLRMRARPKILLASTFEEACSLYDKYKSNLLGVITDMEFSREGRPDPKAGIAFTKKIKAENFDMPVLIQSSDAASAHDAGEAGASFLNKNSPALLSQLQNFILKYLGFGDFVFRGAGGGELGRASDIYSMIELIKTVPGESIEFHANRNHFSKWLMARTEFEIAYHIRPRKISEFSDADGLRRYLIETLYQFIHKTQLGTVITFDGRFYDKDSPFAKIGKGSIGGKARGLSFVNFLLSREDFSKRFEGVKITVPATSVISTDVFDFFLEHNGLRHFAGLERSNDELYAAFDAAKLPSYIMRDLSTIADRIHAPLAVRSSSLLEDSRSQPFAGVYKTYMIPNNHPDPAERLEQLARAVKFVYASTYSAEAKAYMRSTSHLIDEEKMAVIIQPVAGRLYGRRERYYPSFSGVAQSFNYYPVPPMEHEYSVAYAALGLGQTIMEGRRALRFLPDYPHSLIQFSDIKSFLANSQNEFMALDMKNPAGGGYDSDPNIITLPLDSAEKDGVLADLGSVYSPDDDAVYDGISRKGVRLVTFAPILKNDLFPLPEILKFLLELGKQAMACHVEMEFAVTLGRGGGEASEFHILQMKPMLSRWNTQKVRLADEDSGRIACRSEMTLGNGYISGICDIVYVNPGSFNPADTVVIAAEIGNINRILSAEGKSCLLIGPGRWGSADPWLGIPVKWNQISASKVIVEAAIEGFDIDPSYGTHFFHNVTSLGIGYFTVNKPKNRGDIDWNWLDGLPALFQTRYLRHIRLDKPLDIRIDGSSGRGVILKP